MPQSPSADKTDRQTWAILIADLKAREREFMRKIEKEDDERGRHDNPK